MAKSLIAPIFGVFTVLPFAFLAFYSFYSNDPSSVLLSFEDIIFYASNSFYLVVFGCLGALLLGVSTAFLVARYEFFGSKVFAVLFILPLALPSYLSGYAYVWILQKGGFLSTLTGDESLYLDILTYTAYRLFLPQHCLLMFIYWQRADSHLLMPILSELLKPEGSLFYTRFLEFICRWFCRPSLSVYLWLRWRY